MKPNKPINSFAGSLGRLLAGWRHYVPKFSQRSVAPYGSVRHYMKYGLAFLIILFPLHSHACFSGVGYEQNWNDSVSLLLVSLVIGFIATFVRYIQKAKRLYIPLTILAIACIPSIIEILRYGNGDCGTGLMEVSVWPVYIIFTVLFYETVKLVKVKFGVGNA